MFRDTGQLRASTSPEVRDYLVEARARYVAALPYIDRLPQPTALQVAEALPHIDSLRKAFRPECPL